MIITCFYGSYGGMGYIYLKPPMKDFDEKMSQYDNELAQNLNADQLVIPCVTDTALASVLERIPLAERTFKADYDIGYETEYGNDMDSDGYIIGIERSLSHTRFIELIERQAFQVIQTTWRNQSFHITTFDFHEHVFQAGNVLYRLTDAEDSFVIVQLKPSRKLEEPAVYATGNLPTAHIKALITSREDIYPLEYLLKPGFVVVKDDFDETLIFT